MGKYTNQKDAYLSVIRCYTSAPSRPLACRKPLLSICPPVWPLSSPPTQPRRRLLTTAPTPSPPGRSLPPPPGGSALKHACIGTGQRLRLVMVESSSLELDMKLSDPALHDDAWAKVGAPGPNPTLTLTPLCTMMP